MSADLAWLGRSRRQTTGTLEIGDAECGPAEGAPSVLLHGLPYDVRAHADGVATPLGAGRLPAATHARSTGPFEHRLIAGVGHNLPQEAPAAFADAVPALHESTPQ